MKVLKVTALTYMIWHFFKRQETETLHKKKVDVSPWC